MKVVHPKEKKHICGFQNCGEQFAKISELQAHMREKHPRIFICGVCQKQFKDKKSFGRHSKTHSILTSELHVCTLQGCNRGFSEKLALSLHIRTDHPESGNGNSSTRFHCNFPDCKKSYCNSESLIVHQQPQQSGICRPHSILSDPILGGAGHQPGVVSS